MFTEFFGSRFPEEASVESSVLLKLNMLSMNFSLFITISNESICKRYNLLRKQIFIPLRRWIRVSVTLFIFKSDIISIKCLKLSTFKCCVNLKDEDF